MAVIKIVLIIPKNIVNKKLNDFSASGIGMLSKDAVVK